MTLTADAAQYWLDRWDRQQEFYMPDREERFEVVIDIVEETVGERGPLVVDDKPSVHDYLDFLRAAGFREAEILW